MMKILLFGKYGQLGWELHRSLQGLGEIVAYDFPEVDFTKPSSLKTIVESERPQVVVNAAAYTDVDKAESEPEKARLINAEAPGVLAESCRSLGAALIHFSTDYVFDGTKGSPYTEDDEPHPLNVYGQTKLEGEKAVLQAGGVSLIFRTAWVYSLRRDCFVTKVLRWARTQTELRIVDDQISNPTWARALAEATTQVIARAGIEPSPRLAERRGLYHLACRGAASWLEWAKAIVELNNEAVESLHTAIVPAKRADFVTSAKRPTLTALNCRRFEGNFGLRMPDWKLALFLAME